ncbi:MAG TPA: ribonuclease P protein component [Longimicrobiales bacterium]|nr:ribonuclease P protein component [Longimicrobiales bacterium]
MSAARPPAESPRSGGPGALKLPRAARIHSGKEIRALMKRGKRKRTDHVDVFFAASPESFPRLGLVVPKHRHTIVERNRVKRRLREIGRVEVLPRLRSSGCDLDVLIRARPEAYGATFAALRDELVHWTEGEMCALC